MYVIGSCLCVGKSSRLHVDIQFHQEDWLKMVISSIYILTPFLEISWLLICGFNSGLSIQLPNSIGICVYFYANNMFFILWIFSFLKSFSLEILNMSAPK